MVNIPYTTFLLTTVCIVVHSIRFTDLDGLQAHRGRHSRDSESPEIRENTYQGQRARKAENTATKNLRLETTGFPDDDDDEDYDIEDPITFGPGRSAPTPTSTQAPDPTTEYVPDAPRLPEVCTLEPDEGVCDSGMKRRDEFRYFFNPETEECEFFSYSGCNGNGNNFKTEDRCKERCRAPTAPPPTSTPHPTEPTTEYVPDAPRLPKVCTLEPEEGVCDSGMTRRDEFRYFFNHSTEECELFSYSGCNGNGNNFGTAEQCKERCQGQPYDLKEDARLPSVCKERMSKGTCVSRNGPELRYFYNQYNQSCQLFTFIGGEGNGNNFKTREECEDRCLYTPDGECVLPPERGLCRENFTRYHWDKELGDCKAFSYSGCAGNANNFGSQEECQKFCKAKSTYLKLWKKVWDAMQSWMSRGYS